MSMLRCFWMSIPRIINLWHLSSLLDCSNGLAILEEYHGSLTVHKYFNLLNGPCIELHKPDISSTFETHIYPPTIQEPGRSPMCGIGTQFMYAADRTLDIRDENDVVWVQKVEIFDHIAHRSTAIKTLESGIVDGTWDIRFAGDEYLVIHHKDQNESVHVSIYTTFQVS